MPLSRFLDKNQEIPCSTWTRNPSLREPKSITILNLIFLISGLLMKRVTIVLFFDISNYMYIYSRVCFVLHKCLPLFLIYRAVKNASYPESALKKHVQFAYHLYICMALAKQKMGAPFFSLIFFFGNADVRTSLGKRRRRGGAIP